jgi:LmbE family N-acetylglucosaminyl deacetylase
MSRTLIVTAHLDDFEIGMGGTAASLAVADTSVKVVVLCRGDRPGSEHVATKRRHTSFANVKALGMVSNSFFGLDVLEYSDTKLDKIPQTELCNLISDYINEYEPTNVYTHYDADIHSDHCIVSRATRVACRMREASPVDKLLEFSIPGSTEWGYTKFDFNTYFDITRYADKKMEMISKYSTEIRSAPDPISSEMISARDTYHGSLCGYSKAEVFKLIFSR